MVTSALPHSLRTATTATIVACMLALAGCGGGGEGAPPTSPTPPPLSALLKVDPCVASGKGRDYQVGDQAGQLAELDQVPWDSLAPGDTVRIFHRATPYLGKFMIAASGTASAPVRICGVKNQAGLRPIIDGQNAVTRRGLDYGDSSFTDYLHQTRSVIVIKQPPSQGWKGFPTYIQIDGLEVRGATPSNQFTDADGVIRRYAAFGACIWIERGHNITIADNVIHDCTNGIYSKSTDDSVDDLSAPDFSVSKDVRLAGNYVYGNGVVGDDHMHNTYMASRNIIYEFNRYGPQRAGALGNAIKDRSVGTVIRYNFLEGGARAMDLVEAEDFPTTALADPAYRKTFVYGNRIVKNGDDGSFIHYGGDHSGSTPTDNWGEPFFRRGTLYFYHNTVLLNGINYTKLFQISTTLETAEVWNNVIVYAPSAIYPNLRTTQEVNTDYWTSGGNVNLGRNWISQNWTDTDPWHPVPGQLLGQSNLITGASPPISMSTLALIGGINPAVDAATVAPSSDVAAATASHPVLYQLDTQFQPQARAITGAAMDLGAIER